MDNLKRVGFIDYIIVLVKWKSLIIPLCVITMLLSYIVIYLSMDEEFEASSTIIPAQTEDISGILGAVKNLKNLPLDIGGSLDNDEMGIYNTLISSRTVLEEVIDKFNLIEVYDLDTTIIDYREKALKKLTNSIITKETNDGAYEITVLADTPQNAAQITNYIVSLLNKKIVELGVKKSAINREFLEERLNEIRKLLKNSEDSLQRYQEDSGILSAEEQVGGIIKAYSELETQLIIKQVEKSVLEKILDKGSPRLFEIETQVSEFQKKVNKIKKEGEPNSIFLPLQSLPSKAINYFRFLREVEINSALLEFILPLYEKAKFDEQRDTPVIQIIDYAVPPAKKSYPPRTIFTLLITFGVFLLTFFVILIKENETWNNSDKYVYIRKNFFKWKGLR